MAVSERPDPPGHRADDPAALLGRFHARLPGRRRGIRVAGADPSGRIGGAAGRRPGSATA